MLTFFRRIRKGLVDSSQARNPVSNSPRLERYILYAIGEILLVMVGILLALQVNNWNEWRKDREKEKVLLSQLHNEFVNNKVKLEKVVVSNLEKLKGIREIINLFPIDINTIDRETLHAYLTMDKDYQIGTATFDPSNAIINAISSNASIDLISNDHLKHKILSWQAILEDYTEDERTIKQLSIEQYEAYLIDQGILTNRGILDDRVDISFLATPKFESIVHNREGRLGKIYDSPEDPSWQELELLQSTIDEIIELTAPYKQ